MGEANGSDMPSDLEKKVIRQIEYYFGDVNLPKDKFLQEQVKLDDGWVPLSTMIKFNRLKTLTEDFEVIRSALKKSSSGLVEVHEDGEKIRRDPENKLPEFNQERRAELKTKTVYAKGFPTDASLDNIMEFLTKFGSVEHVQMRRNGKKEFKGSVFAQFNSSEDASNFLKEENLKYSETDESNMIKMLRDEYFKMKSEEKKANKEEQDGKKTDEKSSENGKPGRTETITKGALLHLVDIPEGVKREDIKELFGEIAIISWVDFDMGDKEAVVRFQEEGAASTTWEKAKENGDGKVELGGAEIKGDILEGEAETEHWKGIFQSQRDMRNRSKRGGGFRGRGRGRGGYRGGFSNRKHDRSRDREQKDSNQSEEPPVKKVKLDQATEASTE